MVYAGFFKRFFAQIIDMVILIPIIYISIWGSDKSRLFNLYYFIPHLLFFLFYSVYLVQKYGGTPGKLLMKMRITKLDGNPIGYKEALLRESISIIFTILISISHIIVTQGMSDETYFSMQFIERGKYIQENIPSWGLFLGVLSNIWVWSEFLIMMTNKKRRALHDFIAGTVVLDTAIVKKSKFDTIIQEEKNKYKISFFSDEKDIWIKLKKELLEFYQPLGFNEVASDNDNSWMIQNPKNKQAYIHTTYKNKTINLEIFNAPKHDSLIIKDILKKDL